LILPFYNQFLVFYAFLRGNLAIVNAGLQIGKVDGDGFLQWQFYLFYHTVHKIGYDYFFNFCVVGCNGNCLRTWRNNKA
jgi:hypothetical protein